LNLNEKRLKMQRRMKMSKAADEIKLMNDTFEGLNEEEEELEEGEQEDETGEEEDKDSDSTDDDSDGDEDDDGSDEEDDDEEEEEEDPADLIIQNLIDGGKLNKDKEPDPDEDKSETTDPIEFVDEDTYEELLEDRDKMNTVLNKVYDQAKTDLQVQIASEVEAKALQIVDARMAINNFYNNNSDLREHNKVVQTIFEGLANNMPGESSATLLDRAAVLARKHLKLETPKKKSKTKQVAKKKKSKLPKKRGNVNRRHKSKSADNDPLQQEIRAMDEALGRL
jgi:hypothetical protein